MTATPIAMDFCSHPFAAAAFVIEWHVVGMYAPGFFIGALIKRWGMLNVILAGVVLVAGCVVVALNGNTVADFLVALALLGVGWNFMYTGGTTLLTTRRPKGRARRVRTTSLCLRRWASRRSHRARWCRRLDAKR